MSKRFSHSVTVLALAVLSAFAHAQEVPARVGRIALAQGQVTIRGDADDTNAALINWPVTSHNEITTAPGARTELRVGSTAIRLDGDSALEVDQLDDDNLRLHLHYGSVSVRMHNPDALRGFVLSTPQGRVRLQDPGRIRVDAGRDRDASVVSVFEGVALVDGAGSSLTVRAGRRAELDQDDIRTALVVQNSFDDWTILRDRRESHSAAERYVTTEMTGYEELDQNGIWRDDSEYGPLWFPRNVSQGWVPYRDGRWTYLAPWGWTWVDNAPWGYAPFHYGRWVMVNQRWCWAPGRNIGRPVWSPALVGWVGGAGWNLTFGGSSHRGYAPAQGWYPLAPRETFVPAYRVSPERLRYINRFASNDGNAGRDGRNGRDGRDGREGRDNRNHPGLTVVPQDHFGHRGTIVVPTAARPVASPVVLQNAPHATAPVLPASAWQHGPRVDTNHDGRIDQADRGGRGDVRTDRNGDGKIDQADRAGHIDARADRNGDGKVDRNDRIERAPDNRPDPRAETEAAARRAAWLQRERDDNERNQRAGVQRERDRERDPRRFEAPRYSAGPVTGPVSGAIGGAVANAQRAAAVNANANVNASVVNNAAISAAPASVVTPQPAPAVSGPQGDRFGRMRELDRERRQHEAESFNRPMPQQQMHPQPAPMPMQAQAQPQLVRPAPAPAAPAPARSEPAKAEPAKGEPKPERQRHPGSPRENER